MRKNNTHKNIKKQKKKQIELNYTKKKQLTCENALRPQNSHNTKNVNKTAIKKSQQCQQKMIIWFSIATGEILDSVMTCL